MSVRDLHLPKGRGNAFAASDGFTLVELLVVLAIIAILAVASLPGIQGALGGINLKGGSNIVFSQLDLGRQTASTRNLSVDLRLYNTPDASNNPVYRTFALVISKATSGATADEFLEAPVSLPGDAVIDSSTTFSSLLNSSASVAAPPIAVAAEATTAPLQVRNLAYVYFTFLPNGSMNLTTTDGSGNTVPWTLTLINKHAKAATVTGAPAANYITFLLDVPTARARVYQP